MDSLRIWADSAPTTRSPRIIYFEFKTPVVASATNDYLAVRLRGGYRLPMSVNPADTGGLSIVTERPMYILGDYNTTVWRPAALMADAVTFLGNPPNAAMLNTAPASAGLRLLGVCRLVRCDATEHGAACRAVFDRQRAILAGHSAATDTPAPVARRLRTASGLENFPRFLENWSGVVFRYTGSLVSLYTNRYSTGLWGNTGNGAYANMGYYDAPTRQWSFDVNFRFPDRLPPAPSVGTVLQTAFRPLY